MTTQGTLPTLILAGQSVSNLLFQCENRCDKELDAGTPAVSDSEPESPLQTEEECDQPTETPKSLELETTELSSEETDKDLCDTQSPQKAPESDSSEYEEEKSPADAVTDGHTVTSNIEVVPERSPGLDSIAVEPPKKSDPEEIIKQLRLELARERKIGVEWGKKFDKRIEHFRRECCYRPESSYSALVKEHFIKFEKHFKKLSPRDEEIHAKIRKNVQILSSSHSDMYKKLKDCCHESIQDKKDAKILIEKAKRFDVSGNRKTKTIFTNTDFAIPKIGYRKLSDVRGTITDQLNSEIILRSINQNSQIHQLQNGGFNFKNANIVQLVNQPQQNNQNVYVLDSNQFNQQTQKFHVINAQILNNATQYPAVHAQINNPLSVNINVPQAVSSPAKTSPTVTTPNSQPCKASTRAGRKRPLNTKEVDYMDLTFEEPIGIKLAALSKKLKTTGNESCVLPQAIDDFNTKKLKSGTSAGKSKLPPKPVPPRFNEPIPLSVKQHPKKLKIQANFEGESNMKLVWNYEDPSELEKYANSVAFELFVCEMQNKGNSNGKHAWQRIGKKDITGPRIPVKCSLKNFKRQNDYAFIVRGKDEYGRVGKFSEPCYAKRGKLSIYNP